MKSFNIFKIVFYMFSTILFFILSFAVKKAAVHYFFSGFENPLFKFDYITNSGAAFSTLENATVLLVILAFIILFYIIYYICYNAYRLGFFPIFLLSSLSAGICVNLFERIAYGHVVDYINLKNVNFPIFNFPDILIVSSCILLVIYFQLKSKQKKDE